jgi:hypothetical protein
VISASARVNHTNTKEYSPHDSPVVTILSLSVNALNQTRATLAELEARGDELRLAVLAAKRELAALRGEEHPQTDPSTRQMPPSYQAAGSQALGMCLATLVLVPTAIVSLSAHVIVTASLLLLLVAIYAIAIKRPPHARVSANGLEVRSPGSSVETFPWSEIEEVFLSARQGSHWIEIKSGRHELKRRALGRLDSGDEERLRQSVVAWLAYLEKD